LSFKENLNLEAILLSLSLDVQREGVKVGFAVLRHIAVLTWDAVL
jgi:hypothetical protein